MTIIYLSIYVIIVLSLWALYAVARMHSMKFKNFSTHIVPVTNGLMIFLIILTILGFIVIFSIGGKNDNSEIDTLPNSDKIEEVENKSTKNEPIKKVKKEIIKEESYQDEIVDDYY